MSIAQSICGNRTRRDGVVYTCTVARPDGHRGRHSCFDDRTRSWVEWTDADNVHDVPLQRVDPDATMPAKPSSNAKLPALCGNRNDAGGPVWTLWTCSLARGHLGAHECWNAIGTQRVIWSDAEGEPAKPAKCDPSGVRCDRAYGHSGHCFKDPEPPKAAPVKAVEPLRLVEPRMEHAAQMAEHLDEIRAKIARGEIRDLLIVATPVGADEFMSWHSGDLKRAELLGMLEIIKHDWLRGDRGGQ